MNNLVKFCTNCGTKLEDDDKYCTNCGQNTENDTKTKNINAREIRQAKKRLKEITGGFALSTTYQEKLRRHNLTISEGVNIRSQISKEIESGTLSSEDVEHRINKLLWKKKNEKLEEKKRKEKENEIKNSKMKIVADTIKESCPNLKLTNIEKNFIKQIKLEGSASSMELTLDNISKKIIDNRKKLGKIDCEAILIEDGGYKNKRNNLLSSKHEHLAKAPAINTDVFMKVYEDRILLFECILSDYFSENSLERKRTIFFNDIVLMNKGYKERTSLLSMGYDGGIFGDRILNKTGIEISFINNEKIILVFENKDNEELLYNKWIEYKENQENKVFSPSKESDNNISEDILKYAELYEKGLLTEEEFTALKKKLLEL